MLRHNRNERGIKMNEENKYIASFWRDHIREIADNTDLVLPDDIESGIKGFGEGLFEKVARLESENKTLKDTRRKLMAELREYESFYTKRRKEVETLRADKAQLVELAQICFSDDKTIDQPVCCSGYRGNPENACGCMGITERAIAEYELKQVVAEHTEGETNAVCDHGKRLGTYCQPCGRIHGGG
jgi:uncharacterized protein (UPF0335 family)